jgi:pimeloyl-ACP methyl ester carboxylesterase
MIDYELDGKGPATVFLHPVSYDRRLWSGVVRLLATSYTCVLPNERGIGASPLSEAKADRVEDVMELVAHLELDEIALVSSSTSTATALAIALDGGVPVRSVVLIQPALPEYVDPRSERYVGDVMDRARGNAMLKLVGLEVRSVARRRRGRNMSVRDLQWDATDTSEALSWQAVADDMIADFKKRAKHLQKYRPIRVANRLGNLTTPVTLVPVLSKQADQRAAALELTSRLAHELEHTAVVELESEWGELVVLADPERAAQVVKQAIG